MTLHNHTPSNRRSITSGLAAVLLLAASVTAGIASMGRSAEREDVTARIEQVELLQVRVNLTRPFLDQLNLELVSPFGVVTDAQVNNASSAREAATVDGLAALRSIEDSTASTRVEARRLRAELDSYVRFAGDPTPDDLYESAFISQFAGQEISGIDSLRAEGLGELAWLDQLVSLTLNEATIVYFVQQQPEASNGVQVHVDSMLSVVQEAGGYLGPRPSTPVSFAVVPSQAASEVAPEATAGINAILRNTPLWDVDQWVRDWDGGTPPDAPVTFGTLVGESFAARDAVRAIVDERIDAEMTLLEERSSMIGLRILVYRVATVLLLLVAIAMTAAAIKPLRQRSQSLYFQANTDPLTGVGNRHLLTGETKANLADPRYTEHLIAMVDMDRFKMTNDTFGHAAGDQLLVTVAAKLADLVESVLVSDGNVVRLGGDEFAVILHHHRPIDLRRVRRHLDDIRGSTVTTDAGDEIAIEFSYGIAQASGSPDVSALLDGADLAAYTEKANRSPRRDSHVDAHEALRNDGIRIET